MKEIYLRIFLFFHLVPPKWYVTLFLTQHVTFIFKITVHHLLLPKALISEIKAKSVSNIYGTHLTLKCHLLLYWFLILHDKRKQIFIGNYSQCLSWIVIKIKTIKMMMIWFSWGKSHIKIRENMLTWFLHSAEVWS